jgi:hypothetical protein
MSYLNLKSKYNKQAFPENMISKEVLSNHRDLIFEQDDSFYKNKLNDSKNISTSNKEDSFYMEDNYYKKTKTQTNRNFGNKNDWKTKNNFNSSMSMNNMHSFHHQNQNQYNQISSNQYYQQETKVKEYINHLEMSVAENFSVEHSYIRHEKNEKNEKTPRAYDSVYFSMCQDKDHFNQEDTIKHGRDNHDEDQSPQEINKTFFTNDLKEQIDNIPTRVVEYNKEENYNFKQTSSKINSFTPINIKLIYKINEKLKFPRNDPLWYIYHIHSKSSFGPVSSSQVEEMYNMKHIDGQTEIRFIDVFKIKGKGPFAFFRLKEIENQNLLRDVIDPSNLIKYVEELNKIKESARVEVKPLQVEKKPMMNLMTANKNEISNKHNGFKEVVDLTKEEDPYISNYTQNYNNNKNKFYSTQSQTLKKPIAQKIQPPPVQVPINTNIPSVIDEEFMNVKNEEVFESKDVFKKKGKKKVKGKPVDLDIKTGFFTVSQQEKNYEPIYICGEKDD